MEFGSPIIDDSTLHTNDYYNDWLIFPDNHYYWHIRAGNTLIWTEWTDSWEFFIDTHEPNSIFAYSPDTSGSIFTVSWTAGIDPSPSSGIVAYDIYMMTSDNQNWELWLTNYRNGLSATFTEGQHELIYYFEAAAFDSAGNYEILNQEPECSTYVDTTYGIDFYGYIPGDVNMYLSIWPPSVIGSDVTYLINNFRSYGDSDPCLLYGFWASADINGDCNILGSDVTRLVNFFSNIGTIEYCQDYPPLWLSPDDLPVEAPEGWPNCETPVRLSGRRVMPQVPDGK